MENYKGFELASPIHRDKKWTFSGSIGKIDSIRENFVKQLDETLWIEAENYFNEYYDQLLLLSEDKMIKFLKDYREIIFQRYILSLKFDLGQVFSTFAELKQSAHIFLSMRINNFFMFTDLLFAGMMKDPNMLLTEIKDAKLNHLNYITKGNDDYKLFLSAHFEFYLKRKRKTTINYTQPLALEDAANKYKLYDIESIYWSDKFSTILKNFQNWISRKEKDEDVLSYIDKYGDDLDLL